MGQKKIIEALEIVIRVLYINISSTLTVIIQKSQSIAMEYY